MADLVPLTSRGEKNNISIKELVPQLQLLICHGHLNLHDLLQSMTSRCLPIHLCPLALYMAHKAPRRYIQELKISTGSCQ